MAGRLCVLLVIKYSASFGDALDNRTQRMGVAIQKNKV